jgi:capsular exopolysaccharide synthesis family protein
MELKKYISPLLKWWWLIVLSTGIAAGVSYNSVQQQPVFYQSRTVLMIGRTFENPDPTNAEFVLGEQLAQSYADFARREPVRNATMEALQLRGLPDYSVHALPKTQFIEVLVLDTNPERSQAVANELAHQLIRLSPTGPQGEEQQRIDFINQQLNDMQTQIEETKAEIEAKQSELGELFSAQQITEAENEINALQTKLNTIQSNYAALLSSSQQESINALSVIESASRPGAPVDPGKEITIATAAAVGFALAVGAAYLLEYLDDRIKTPEEIEKLVSLPTLTALSNFKMPETERQLVTYYNPRAPISEAFRVLRTNIQFAHMDKPKKLILVTSSRPEEGKSFTATNLATVLAQAQNKVLLIDTDLRRPKQHKNLQLNREPGLTDLLLALDSDSVADNAGTNNLDLFNTYIQATIQSRLFVLSGGSHTTTPSEVLGSNPMRQLLAQLCELYDYVILDSTPVLAGTEAVVLSVLVDGVILVVDTKKTRSREIKQVVERLQGVGAEVEGVVLNRRPAAQGYGYYEFYNKIEKDNKPGGKSARSLSPKPRWFQRAGHKAAAGAVDNQTG